jgi:general secretion pathway protein A
MIDEVQMLNSKETMEEFRGLLNMETSEGKMLNFIFFGLPELEDVLSLDEPLKQRVAVKIRIKAFSEDDTRVYINHRLKIAGCNKEIFSEEAIKLIYLYTHGLPRRINTVCDNALLEGYLFKANTIDAETIKTVAVDLGLDIRDK